MPSAINTAVSTVLTPGATSPRMCAHTPTCHFHRQARDLLRTYSGLILTPLNHPSARPTCLAGACHFRRGSSPSPFCLHRCESWMQRRGIGAYFRRPLHLERRDDLTIPGVEVILIDVHEANLVGHCALSEREHEPVGRRTGASRQLLPDRLGELAKRCLQRSLVRIAIDGQNYLPLKTPPQNPKCLLATGKACARRND